MLTPPKGEWAARIRPLCACTILTQIASPNPEPPLARLREPVLPEIAIVYTRQVTKVWCLFFMLNGLVAASLTLWAPLSWWTLYNGLIAYALMGLLFFIEWLIRQKVRGRA